MSALYSIAFLAGLVSFLSPCIVPMLTAYFSLIFGLSPDRLNEVEAASKQRAAANTIFFSLAFTLVFTLAGGAAGTVGLFLLQYMTVFNWVGGIFLLLLALNLLGVRKLPHFSHVMPARLTAQAGRPLACFVGGLFFAIACSHCLGATLYSILLAAGATGSPSSGMLVMFLFSLGLAVPYLLVGLFLDRALPILKRNQVFTVITSRVSGAMLLFFAALLLSGRFTLLTSWAARILPFSLSLGM
ncbi:MAG TPA: cytochrome C biogenesis protein [Firmicutes bacterium]|nr:cytochrome C biogenesis protein [Bacillota bacterium]